MQFIFLHTISVLSTYGSPKSVISVSISGISEKEMPYFKVLTRRNFITVGILCFLSSISHQGFLMLLLGNFFANMQIHETTADSKHLSKIKRAKNTPNIPWIFLDGRKKNKGLVWFGIVSDYRIFDHYRTDKVLNRNSFGYTLIFQWWVWVIDERFFLLFNQFLEMMLSISYFIFSFW